MGPQPSLDEILELGSGTANFVSQFKPRSLGMHNARALLVDETQHTTPNDHYFGYINRRQGQSQEASKQDEIEVMKSLGLELYLPPTFNLETGRYDDPKLLDEQGKPLDESEMDVFELARMRRTSINDLRVMNETPEQAEARKSQRHSKKDYEKLKSMSMGDILAMAKEQKTYKEFQDDQLQGIVKVEKKKTYKRRSRGEKEEQADIMKKLLDSPQDLDYEKAMKLYEQQPLEVKDITS